jgi:hypothetical protein
MYVGALLMIVSWPLLLASILSYISMAVLE